MSICAMPEELERGKFLQEPEQLEAQSRAAVIAYLQDSSVQLEQKLKHNDSWHEKKGEYYFNLVQYYYRIAKPRKWYRVGEDINGCLIIVSSGFQENCRQSQVWFKRWLDERKYYD